MQIISNGGFYGFSSSGVNQNDSGISDALISVNGVNFQNVPDSITNVYVETLSQLSYFLGTKYTVVASHMGSTIAKDLAEALLGTQSYVWDTQTDMAIALLGTILALIILAKTHMINS